MFRAVNPFTWFEDLGRAKRVSIYHVYDTGSDRSEHDSIHFHTTCDVLVDGEIRTEGVHYRVSLYDYRIRNYGSKKGYLRKMIRSKYPKQTQ